MKDFDGFISFVTNIVKLDDRIIALCIAGSWISNEIDQYSDLDLVLITKNEIVFSKEEMIKFANTLGPLSVGFSGEHVGENKLLICLYENPILHVDLKFVQINDFFQRVENPTIIYDKNNIVKDIYSKTTPKWPNPDFQWIEDRFWVWIHYAATKLGRGEWIETIDFISFLRLNVIGPLYHLKYNSNPRGVRKLEFILNHDDLDKIKKTISAYSFISIKNSIYETIKIYKELREILFDNKITYVTKAESLSIEYLNNIE
jgi:hypothetical protein